MNEPDMKQHQTELTDAVLKRLKELVEAIEQETFGRYEGDAVSRVRAMSQELTAVRDELDRLKAAQVRRDFNETLGKELGEI